MSIFDLFKKKSNPVPEGLVSSLAKNEIVMSIDTDAGAVPPQASKEMMHTCLKTHTISALREQGFTGTYPHFRRIGKERIDLVSFQSGKWGGAFTVEVSAAFPGKKKPNFKLWDNMTLDTLNVTATNKRYRLPGMFDGWFYYTDVYAKRILLFGIDYLSTNDPPPRGYKAVQKFSEAVAVDICGEVNRQLQKAFVWLENFEG